MASQRKIQSVTELAKFRVGDVAWWVILRPLDQPADLPADDLWMKNQGQHPKTFYEWGPGKAVWGKALLPKLQYSDFAGIVTLLTSKILVEQFPVCDIIRCRNTGEFIYSNEDDEWMPEPYLLTTKLLAEREKDRILRLFRRWIDRQNK